LLSNNLLTILVVVARFFLIGSLPLLQNME